MPDPPTVNIFTRYILENPWPIGLALLGVAAGLLWLGLREGLANRIKLGGIFALVSAGVIATGQIVTTPAEHGRSVTRQFVDAAAEQRLNEAEALLAPDAMLGLGSPTNPGFDRNTLTSAMQQLRGRYAIDWHQITTLNAYTREDDLAEIHMTILVQSPGTRPIRSRWVIHINRQPDDDWLINRITCISINDREPRERWFR